MRKLGTIKWGEGQNLLKAFAVALLLPVTIICVGLTIYFGNSSELGIDLASVLTVSLAFLVFTTMTLFVVQLPFVYLLKGKMFASVNAFLLVAGCGAWVQANVFNWNMGPLIGSIPFGQFRYLGYLEIGVYLIAAILAIKFYKSLFKYSAQFACILVATQVLCLIPFAFKETQTANLIRPNFAEYEYTFNHLFDYSQEEDVYVFVLDAFGVTAFDKIAAEFSCSEKYKDFTYFPKNLVFYPAATKWSIPRILSGLDRRDDRYNIDNDSYHTAEHTTFFREAFSQNTLFDYLTQNGYDCRVFSWYPSSLYWNPQTIKNIRAIKTENSENTFSKLRLSCLVELTIFRLLPLKLKKTLCRQGLLTFEGTLLVNQEQRKAIFDSEYLPMFLQRDDYFFRKIQEIPWNYTPQCKQFKLIHLCAIHSLGTTMATVRDSFDANKLTVEEAELLLHFEKQHEYLSKELLVAKRTLDRLHSIFERMKENGAYDRSLIVIMGDHGERAKDFLAEIDPAAKNKPLLLVKPPMARHDTMQMNANPVNISDTKNAILSILNLPRPEGAFSWFDIPEELVEQRNAEWSAYFDYLNEKAKKP